jgi:allantoicase
MKGGKINKVAMKIDLVSWTIGGGVFRCSNKYFGKYATIIIAEK